MTPGGTDLLFVCPGKVDVLEVVLRHFQQKWPKLVYESACEMGAELKEFFIYSDPDIQKAIDELGVEDHLAPYFVHLLFGPFGQTVSHYIQEVTLVVDKVTEDIFPVIEAIQREFLLAYMD